MQATSRAIAPAEIQAAKLDGSTGTTGDCVCTVSVRGAREQSLKRLMCSRAFSSAGLFYPSEQSRHWTCAVGIEVVPAAQLAVLLLGGIRAEFRGRRGPRIPKDQWL